MYMYAFSERHLWYEPYAYNYLQVEEVSVASEQLANRKKAMFFLTGLH